MLLFKPQIHRIFFAIFARIQSRFMHFWLQKLYSVTGNMAVKAGAWCFCAEMMK